MNDVLGVLLAILLIGANAFFVGAEFSLISARRDRLEALAEQGKATAVTVIRAGEQLPSMLAGAQLGVTVASLLLGRIGESAVSDLLRTTRSSSSTTNAPTWYSVCCALSPKRNSTSRCPLPS
jgi:CBS domain containing-hemolysin-like protein